MQLDHQESEILHISSHKFQSKVSEVSVVHSISKTISVLLFVTNAGSYGCNLTPHEADETTSHISGYTSLIWTKCTSDTLS